MAGCKDHGHRMFKTQIEDSQTKMHLKNVVDQTMCGPEGGPDRCFIMRMSK